MTDTQVNPLIAGQNLQDAAIRRIEDTTSPPLPLPPYVIDDLQKKTEFYDNWKK